MTARERLETFGRLTSPALQAYRSSIGWDLLVARADGPYVHDDEGRSYVDAHTGAGIANLGHRPATVVAALKRAARETDQGNFPMISAEKAALGRDLAAFLGGELPRVTYGVMRGEAVDFAGKLARGVTGRPRLLAAAGWVGRGNWAHVAAGALAPLLSLLLLAVALQLAFWLVVEVVVWLTTPRRRSYRG